MDIQNLLSEASLTEAQFELFNRVFQNLEVITNYVICSFAVISILLIVSLVSDFISFLKKKKELKEK